MPGGGVYRRARHDLGEGLNSELPPCDSVNVPVPLSKTHNLRLTFARAPYFARGFGRTWNFTTFGLVPLPPSWCHGVYIP